MALRIDTLTVDCHDPRALARWWAEVLGWRITQEDGDEVVIEGDGGAPILFDRNPDDKTVKNRLHLDLRPDDQAAEVARLEALGAVRVDLGQGPEDSWVVMADPEGNELCVLRATP